MKITLPYDTPKGQREAVTANDRVITVEAGAGTGKTWVLSQRYLNLLLNDDELLPSEILTLTYTEAAAGEMKARIENLIALSLNLFPNSERKQKILDGLSDSWISTIHSFAGRLIRESGLSLDIDPRASVITAHQEQSFWEEIRNAAEFANLEKLAHNYAGGEILKAAQLLDKDSFMSSAVSKWGAANLTALARNTAELHASSGRSWEDMMAWAGDDSSLLVNAERLVCDYLRPQWLSVWKLWKNISLHDLKETDVHGNALQIFLDSSRANPPANDEGLRKFYDRIVNDHDFIGRTKALTALREDLGGKTLSEWRKQQPSIIKNITAGFASPLTDEELRMRRTLLKFCAVSWGMWDNMKSKRGLLSFSDMILHAKKTIEQKGIRRTFRHILVDEFQDTDPVQFGMIESLRNYGSDSGLFAVGDPKQSIYKFRHADPSLFAEIISRQETKRVHLDKSFRTRAGLLGKINSLFTNLWPDGISRQESMRGVKYNSLEPASPDVERESGTMPDFRIYLLRNIVTAVESRKILAGQIASKISSWVADGLSIWDKKDKIIRPVKFSDFAILSRGRGSFTILEEALQRVGIPSIQDRSNDYFGRGETGDVVCTLRAAADMNDDFSVTGWLMSPFSGVNEDEAISKCLMLTDDTHRPVDLIRENLPDAYSRLEYLSVVGENEGASGILSFYDRNREWLSCYREKDRLRVLRNVRLSLKIAREFQSSGTASLVSCAEYMTRSVRNESSYEEPSWHDENENAVRLGAVHSAKGLEYPVTVIFEDRTRRNAGRESLMPSKELGLVAGNLPDENLPAGGFSSKLSEWSRLLSEQGDTEEEERLFYVACTRAQDSLIFCGLIKPVDKKNDDTTPKGYAGTWSDFLLKSIKGMNDAVPEILNPDGKLPEPPQNNASENKTLITVETVKAQRALRQFSATSFSLYEWCPFAWRRKYRQGLTLEWELTDRENNDDVIGGAETGSLVHWILSKWPVNDNYESELERYLHDKATLSLLPGHIRDAWRKNDRDKKSTLRELLMNFAGSPLGIELRNSPNVEREHRFRHRLNDDTILAGAVDALFGNNIIDYKITDSETVPPGLYESQLDFYAYVVHAEKKFESVNTCISFLKENKTAERVISDFESIRERIETASAKCASDSERDYEGKTEHCGLCPFKKGCVKFAGTVHE
ncbi:MAG: UvrD-helicase domain-containing protein [Synergistaceae bacterium]|nr:UvrD-helicase domain-containing protein [Synergistaceae bacterium]